MARAPYRVASRLRAKSRPGRTVSVRVRFADLRSITRSTTLDAPIASTVTLAEIAEELVHKALAHHPDEKIISLLAISVSQLEKRVDLQLELPLALGDDRRRPGGGHEFSFHSFTGSRADGTSGRGQHAQRARVGGSRRHECELSAPGDTGLDHAA